jgi:hypothetical protein
MKPGVALRAGSRIGSGRLFGNADILAEHLSTSVEVPVPPTGLTNGRTEAKAFKNGYLGLKFTISGKVHFGWERVTVTTSGKTFIATLTGYAYETIPNKSIIAGKTKGPNDAGAEQVGQASAPTPQIPSLGLHALGSPSLWRPKESEDSTQ